MLQFDNIVMLFMQFGILHLLVLLSSSSTDEGSQPVVFTLQTVDLLLQGLISAVCLLLANFHLEQLSLQILDLISHHL